jgi:hypothetical protein
MAKDTTTAGSKTAAQALIGAGLEAALDARHPRISPASNLG